MADRLTFPSNFHPLLGISKTNKNKELFMKLFKLLRQVIRLCLEVIIDEVLRRYGPAHS